MISFDLTGKVAGVTGASSGLGQQFARALSEQGCDVAILARRKERLEEFSKELKQNGHDCLPVSCDVTDEESIKNAVKAVVDHFGKIDILVNNAGVQSGVFGTTTEAQYDLVLDTNLKGVYFLSQLFAQYMRNNQIHGNILNIASSSSLRPANSPYIISKWGIKGLTLGLAKMLIPYNIVVNGIAPGPTATPMLHRDEMQGIENDRNPMKRLVSPIEIANMAVVLTSGLGRSVVGDIVYMTGGAGVITMDDVECNLK